METSEKDVVRRFYAIVNRGRPEDLDEVCSADLKGHAGAGADLKELKDSIASFLAPFPDLAAEPRYLVQEDDLVSVWLTYTATHQGEFAGVPASGRRLQFAGWDLIRVNDGEMSRSPSIATSSPPCPRWARCPQQRRREEGISMNRSLRMIAVPLVAAAALLAAGTAPAAAAPSCVAQTVQAEHDLYGTAWGHDVIARIAADPGQFGLSRFGELASFAASQDRTPCPPDL